MPNQSKEFPTTHLPLKGHSIPPKEQVDVPTSIQLLSTEYLLEHHVKKVKTSLHFKPSDSMPQAFNTSHTSGPENVMADLEVFEKIVDQPLVEKADVLPLEAEHLPINECLTNHGPFQIGDPGPQQQYAAYNSLLTDLIKRPHQADDDQSHHQSEDPTSILQDDMETGNDSSSNDLNEMDEHGKESGSKSGSSFQTPSCSSNAFSLMMEDTEHNPSTSGYSSEQPVKAKTQKELKRILKELRSHLPPERKCRGMSSTAAALQYALHCIQQVKAIEEYYQLLMINDDQPCGQDLSCYAVEEIASITSEYTKNNMDVFAVAVSLLTGRILYISDQASVVLRCSTDQFSDIRFVELLAPQDISMFYSSTNPYRLPSWNICSGGDSGYLDSLEEKSFYCRIRCGRGSRRETSYHPFRLTPYLIRVQTEANGSSMEQLCCVLFAERVHSGYEAPRIPADKRIFTTTHTPNCLFQDVDERAVPLLGYLPQDLIGSPIILHVHPSDRPLMLAVHKKILQYGGQPFEFSPLRFCARNGEYITIDTSWSSFINPWSRKVSFIIGRHKVRMGPVNEDVFTAPLHLEDQSVQPEIQELTAQIHQLLMQPVHNSGSSGYGSLGSNGSHENPLSGASSSDSNGNLNEDVKEKHGALPVCDLKAELGSKSPQKKAGQNLDITPETGAASKVKKSSNNVNCDVPKNTACPSQCEPLPAKQPPYSYQQINCLDSVIRYLESCSVLSFDKQRFVSPGSTVSFASDDDPVHNDDQRDPDATSLVNPLSGAMRSALCPQSSSTLCGPSTSACQALPSSVPHPSLTSLPVSGAAITQLSRAKAESVVSLTSHCSYSSTIVHVGDKKLQPETELEDGPSVSEVPLPASVSTEKEPYRLLGLTKEVLVAHTQKEENDFLNGFMDIKKLSAFQTRCNSYMHDRPRALRSHGPSGADAAARRGGKARKPKVKRVRPESWDSSSSGLPQAHRPPLVGLNNTAWSQSDTSHASYPPLPYSVLPAYPLPVFPSPHIQVPNETTNGTPSTSVPVQPLPAQLLSPMVALVLPNYMYPPGIAPTVYPAAAPPHSYPVPVPVQPPIYTPQSNMNASNPAFLVPPTAFHVPPPLYHSGQHAFPVPQPSCAPQSVQNPCPVQPFLYPDPPSEPKMKEGISRSSTPLDPPSPPLFQSRCSSPLQLNLLQLEESQKADRADGGTGGPGNSTFMSKTFEDPPLHMQQDESPAHNSDALSTGSDLMDMLLQEDASSGTCSASSAVSESLTSGSHGNGTSLSQTGSSQTSRSSKYFGSVDSSENNQKSRHSTPSGESVMKYVLQDPMWLLMANADEQVMMTYQIQQRDMDLVLREDRKKLKSMQKLQPRFTDDQRKELAEIHPWLHRGGLPWATEGCVFCTEKDADCAEYTETIQELELSGIMEPCD